MMKYAFYFILKALFGLKIFQFFVLTFLACRKNGLDEKDKLNFKIYDITAWLTKNYNTHIDQYLMS